MCGWEMSILFSDFSWSFGMLLWEIFTLGQWPYDRLEGSKLERAIKEGERPPKPELASVAM